MVAEEPSKVIRQFSLIHAMLASRFGLTIDEILNTVDGYRDTFDPYSEKSLAAVTKSFERDKKEIRDLGIVIQTRSPADASDDNHGVRYLIDPATYVLPPDVEFSRGEIALLQLAARAWQHGSMNKEALRALNKLRSLGIEPDSSLTGVRPRISGWNSAVNEFGEILSQDGVAEFDYLKPGDVAATTRQGAPLALIDWNGLWYLLAWDLDRNAERTFLVSRVTTVPRMVPGKRHERPDEDFAARLTAELEELASHNIARVRVVPDSDADFRLTAKYGGADARGEISIPTADLDLLADELSEFGTDIEVAAPAELRTRLGNRFDLLAASQGGEAMSQSVGRAPRRQQNPRPQATDIVARMLSVVPFLIDNSPISVTEAASTFGVSEDEMRIVVRTLFVTGVPGDSGKGLHGDLFDFDFDSFEADDIIDMTNHVGPAETPRFSGREAAALIAGLQYMSDVVRDEERSSVDALVNKIRRGATGSPENISVRRAPLPDRAVPLASAISDNLQVEFFYLNAEGSLEERRVCPIRLDVVGNTWYLRGFCHLRDSMRTFRTDRMRNVLVLSEARDHQIDPASLPDTLFDAPSADSGIVITVEISESAVSLLSDYGATVSEPTGGVVRAELTVAHLVNLRKLVTLAPGVVRVVSPDFAVAEVARWATSGASWHKNDPLTRA